jgi:chemotaxis methyl-accepting protein methylase/PAS domain-containing protein
MGKGEKKSGSTGGREPSALVNPARSGAARKATRSPSPPAISRGSTVVKDTGYVVGIGASAGGLDAFEQFFTNMPVDSGMAFVLIPHLAPEHKSMMVELLTRYTKMGVFQAENGMRVDPNCVYIIPPNKDMVVMKRTLQLLEPVDRRGLRHPIDYFLRSLAEDQGDRAVCIVLSGTGSEGTLGLRAIKEKGGLVLVQDPKTTRYDGMPGSAIATGVVDYVLPPDKMPGQILRYLKHTDVRPLKPVVITDATPGDPLKKIIFLIRSRNGHDFSLYKQNTLMRRIEKRMAILQIGSKADYATFLRSNPQEIDLLFRELLIRVTNFFRDGEAYEIVKEKALPLLFKDLPPEQPVRIWVPACSTGEEAYSVAIIVQEYIGTLKQKYSVQIFATDIDKDAIDMARTGLYPEGITVDVSPERMNRFFTKKAATYKVKEEIRKMIVFAVQNIIRDPPFTKLQMISCRNVLIYFDAELQKKVLPIFHYALKPGGILHLGASETIGDHADMFSVVDRKWKIFRARGAERIPAAPSKSPTAKASELAAESVAAPAIKNRGEESKEHAPPEGEISGKGPQPSRKKSLRVAELSHELKTTKEQLQTTIEELETANQELGSTNEELQSANEELQSSLEEMETSREELQSTNEELLTINTEFQLKAEESDHANNDMNNMIASTQIANLFLDCDLRIKRYTPAMLNVLNLVETDIGRPVGDFSLKLDYPDMEKDIEEVLRTLALKEREVKHRDGLWYLARILAYRTTDNSIDGVVIAFIDITEQKSAQEALQDALIYAEGIVETVREPLIVLDADLRVVTANMSFYQVFKTSRGDVEKKRFFDIGNRQWNIPALREHLEKILPDSVLLENFEVACDFPELGHKRMLLNARRIHQKGQQTRLILLAIEDITGRKE